MLVRVRTRDGTEKVEIEETATLKDLRQKLETLFKVPFADQTLSLDQKLLLAPNTSAFKDLADASKSLKALKIAHGSIVFLRYSVEREVTPCTHANKGVVYGAKTTIADMIAKQTRIEIQEKPRCQSVSFDQQTANQFQAYIGQATAFSLQRMGFLYGTRDESNAVQVHCIYEPPQQGAVDSVELVPNEAEQKKVDFIAQELGLSKVGWIFSASAQQARDFALSEKEIRAMAALQAEYGEYFVTAVVSQQPDEETGAPTVHFEAFQCSEQCVRLASTGWFVPSDDPKFTATNPEKEMAVVAGKDTRRIECEFLITVVPILDHEGPLQTAFPIENRLTGQTADDLKAVLQAAKGKPYVMRVADFHLLLFLAQSAFELHDVALLCEAVKNMEPVPEGFCLLIDAIAGIQ